MSEADVARHEASEQPAMILTVNEAAGQLKVSTDVMYNLVHTGRIPSFRPTGKRRGKILIRKSDLEAYVNRMIAQA